MSEPLRVLIAEDEALILMQLEFLVEDAGHVVVGSAATAEEAIGVAREVRPDLVFVDLQLRGGSSGLDIVRTLRDEAAMILIFVTANAQHLPEGFEGAAGVIAKPFTEAVIFDTLAYFSECVRAPPPRSPLPLGLRLAPAYRAALSV
ncbi:response regulator [Methylobacterium sp. Leaf125]|uniref:response regulator n=1 Tax=Methylobacterium sp. Leaf125 TaxID=1736265 RepID=UPI0006FD3C26|nr:response regulator [Methylobacterium sp. Leaf125]KQQ47819.1 response regulator [Methylobacterium sp. Leaf125]